MFSKSIHIAPMQPALIMLMLVHFINFASKTRLV